MITLIESAREAMQGFSRIIPTNEKIQYLRLLMNAGFDILDAGSIVSPKFVPQMADTLEVINGLEMNKKTRIMVLAASLRGAESAVA
ncbi:MAG: hypothetical protein ACM3N9_03925, partial [Syntrophothermus sp.]